MFALIYVQLKFHLHYLFSVYKNSVTVIYDFSTMLPESLNQDLENLITKLNLDLVSDILLIQNNCENQDTVNVALAFAKRHAKVSMWKDLNYITIHVRRYVSTTKLTPTHCEHLHLHSYRCPIKHSRLYCQT